MTDSNLPERRIEPSTLRTGDLAGRVVLGRYRVLCLLARGGMGEVYLARSEGALGFHRPVVIKRVLAQHATDKTIVGLFRREATVMSNLRHPNVVSVLDFGEDQGDHVMAIEYVHGYHLGRWLTWTAMRRPFPVERAIEIVLQVLEALENAHTAHGADGARLGIVHRDVSPGNVLIDIEGQVRLADFGVARIQGEHTEVPAGETALRGKFPYLSPELFDGVAASPASDTYAAAVVLDEILRGANAFKARNVTDTIGKAVKFVPPPLDKVRGDVPPAVAQVVAKAIAKKQGDRFESAAAFAAALRGVRRSTGDEARAELSRGARADFLDPVMAETLRVPKLSELEALWHAPTEVLASVPPPRIDDEIRTQSAVASKRRAPSRWVVPAAIAGTLVLSAIAFGAWEATRPAPLTSSGPVVILVDHGAAHAPAASSAVVPAVVDAGPAIAPVAVVLAPPATTEVDPTHRTTRAPAIEAPFRAHSAQISRCFTDHVQSLEGTPELTVRFDVRADGSVAHASLVPQSIESTGLGTCLLNIANDTRFARQPSSVSFSVPLGARRVAH